MAAVGASNLSVLSGFSVFLRLKIDTGAPLVWLNV
jgi:hypothetical protein